jgi:hypothetical protein
MNKKSILKLILGMHMFDGFTRSQYEADVYLRLPPSKNAGDVKVASQFNFTQNLQLSQNIKPVLGFSDRQI